MTTEEYCIIGKENCYCLVPEEPRVDKVKDFSRGRDIDSVGGDPRFKDALWQILLLHEKKQNDYGTDQDPFANVRASVDFGVPAWIGVAIRMNDKMRRLMTGASGKKLSNESLLDSFMDLAVYGAIGAVLVEEEAT